MLEESELLIFRRPPSASLAAVGEPYSSAVGLLMEDPKSPPEKGGPGAGDAAGRLKDKRRSRASVRKKVRRKLLEPAPNLSSFAIPVRMTPLSLLLVRRIWLFSANAFERLQTLTVALGNANLDYHGITRRKGRDFLGHLL